MKKWTAKYAQKNVICDVLGLFIYKQLVNQAAVDTFLDDYISHDKIDFDELRGSFLAMIQDPEKGNLYFSDNSGMRRWYFNITNNTFSNTLTAVIDNKTMNPQAVAQFLYFGCIYSNDTVIANVKMSEPECYYVLKGKELKTYSKSLKMFDEIFAPDDEFEHTMKLYCKATMDWEKNYVTITGGVDSRTVLSHVLFNKFTPLLDITGHPDDIDVIIAKKIADHCNLNLAFVEEGTNEKDWLNEAIMAAKLGGGAVLGTWRLYKKARFLKSEGEVIECGGLNGEVYKNSFINQDYPIYFGKKNWKKFLKYKVFTYRFPLGICGEIIKKQMSDMDIYMEKWLQQFEGPEKSKSYIKAGYKIVQQRSAALSAMYSEFHDSYYPLLERRCVASVYNKNAYQLEMQSWQRQQISKYCPLLKNIKTDRGLTADINKIHSEWLKSMLFLVKVFAKRLIPRGKSDSRIDGCFEEGLNTELFKKSFSRCQELGIIAEGINPNLLTKTVADRVFLLGSLL